jgi:hypothetical protein
MFKQRYSKEEDRLILEDNLTAKELSIMLGRSVHSISTRKNELKCMIRDNVEISSIENWNNLNYDFIIESLQDEIQQYKNLVAEYKIKHEYLLDKMKKLRYDGLRDTIEYEELREKRAKVYHALTKYERKLHGKLQERLKYYIDQKHKHEFKND